MVSLNIYTTTHTVRQALGLFKDLLQHKVWESTLLYLTQIDVNRLHSQFLFFTKNTDNLQFFTTLDKGNVSILEIHHLIRVFHDRTGVRTQEKLILTDTYYQRTLLTGCHNLVWITLVENGNGIGANHLIEGHLYCCQKVQVLMLFDIFDQLYQHLRIRIRNKLHALGLELRLQLGIILNDTIVDNGQIARLGIMGMGIHRRRFTMRCPTGMGNADGATHILVTAKLHQIVNLTLGLKHIQFGILVNQGHSGTVITTILKSAKSLNQNRKSFLISNISYDSAHSLFLLFVV